MSIQGSWDIPEFDASDRFRKAREKLELDQRQFAELINVDKNTVSNYETGKTKRHVRAVVAAWALATAVPPEWLLYGVLPEDGPGGLGVPRKACDADVVQLDSRRAVQEHQAA